MSKDLLLAAYCPHLIRNERLTPSSRDRRSYNLSLFSKDPSQVRVRVNGVMWPSSGLMLPVQVYGTTQSPFKVPDTVLPGGSRRGIKLSLNKKIFILPPGSYSCSDIVSILNSAKLGALFENIGGYLSITDSSGKIGKNSTLELSGFDIFAGISGGIYTGKTTYPPWYLTPGLTGSVLNVAEPVRSNPVIHIDYASSPETCPRCYGAGIENDFNFDQFGQVSLIADENLLYQSVMKILLTDVGSNPYHTWYGSSIKSRVGVKSISTVASQLRTDVLTALGNLQDLQKRQRVYQTVSLKELLYSVSDIQVYQDTDNPQLFNITVEVRNAASGDISLSIFYAAAQVSAKIVGSEIGLGF